MNAKKQFGSIINNNIEYALCDQAQMDNIGTDGDMCYQTIGISHAQMIQADNQNDVDFCFDPHVKISWLLSKEYLNSDDTDEANACDWDHPDSVEIVD